MRGRAIINGIRIVTAMARYATLDELLADERVELVSLLQSIH